LLLATTNIPLGDFELAKGGSNKVRFGLVRLDKQRKKNNKKVNFFSCNTLITTSAGKNEIGPSNR
jgi:hypothetical protein